MAATLCAAAGAQSPLTAEEPRLPIRRELRSFYPRNWRTISAAVRFGRAGGCCEQCRRPHLRVITCLPDGRWLDPTGGVWRDARGRAAVDPDLFDLAQRRLTRVVLAAAHRDHDPRHNNRRRNLRAFCQRCHLRHDRAWHARQRWLTYRLRSAFGDLFLGPYAELRSAGRTLLTSTGERGGCATDVAVLRGSSGWQGSDRKDMAGHRQLDLLQAK